MTDQLEPKRNSLYSRGGALIVSAFIVILALGVIVYYFSRQNDNSLQTNNSNIEGEISEDTVALYDWERYDIDQEANALIYIDQQGETSNIDAPFALADYSADLTKYGFLFWKVGEEKTIPLSEIGDEFTYNAGTQPDFRWYDFSKKEFVTLPEQAFTVGDQKFESVFMLHPSSSEPKVMIEIGMYDTNSEVFKPSLLESQPVSVRGIVFDAGLRTVTESPALKNYLDVLGATTTLSHGMSWDSKRNVAVAVPNGESCGAFDSLTFVDLEKKTKEVVGGKKSFSFADEECNPKNGVSTDNAWFVLFGKSEEKQIDVYLFSAEKLGTPVVEKKGVSVEEFPDSVDMWEPGAEFPVITFNTGDVVDFN